MAQSDTGEIKRSAASLIGGIFVAIFVFVLWLLLMGGTAAASPLTIAIGLLIAVPLGVWVRIADL